MLIAHSKICFKCKEEKPLAMYYKHSQMADGHVNKCKDCAKKDMANTYVASQNRIKKYESKRSKCPERKAKALEYQKNMRKKWPEKNRARYLVMHAIKSGRLTPQPCIHCGDEEVEAHHRDYFKPLDVVWVCFYHHRTIEHGQKFISSKEELA